jgi:hypothetical protein
MLASAPHTAADPQTAAGLETTNPRFVRIASLACLALIAAALCAMAYQIAATGTDVAARQCATIHDDAARLACYDAVTVPARPGKGASVPQPSPHQ